MNIESFLRKRRIINSLKSIFQATKKAVSDVLTLIFAKRQILVVTNEKIRTITLGPISQLCIFLVLGWVINLFIQSLTYDKIIGAKSEEIARLKNVNGYFEAEFGNMNDKLKKVKEYLILTTGEATPASDSKQDLQLPKNFEEGNLSDLDKETLNEIKDASDQMLEIKMMTESRIKKIEKTIALTGLNIKRPAANSINELKKAYPKVAEIGAQGGPFVALSNVSASQLSIRDFSKSKIIDTAKFVNGIDRLMTLEKITTILPLSRPIKHYSISSGFGARVDPITKGLAMHQGLDFVGPKNEKIISPSSGRVILAGTFSGYGNAIVIDHGFGITTRYGHLSKVKVKTGQRVKQGDVIALQGSTGRSTGAHLHYEVRYKNIPLNPRKFIEAGDIFFNDSRKQKYANS